MFSFWSFSPLPLPCLFLLHHHLPLGEFLVAAGCLPLPGGTSSPHMAAGVQEQLNHAVNRAHVGGEVGGPGLAQPAPPLLWLQQGVDLHPVVVLGHVPVELGTILGVGDGAEVAGVWSRDL